MKPRQTANMKPPEVVQQFRRMRQRLRMTQVKGAELIGVPARTLRLWEEGTRRPKPIVLKVIASVLEQHRNN